MSFGIRARMESFIRNPATEIFTSLASMRIPRTYHSLAILLPDARVFVGGGLCGNCQANHADAEIFTPPYLLNSDGSSVVRPKILSAPATASYGATIRVTIDSAINSFVLVRLSSVTHSVNNDQRRIPLGFSRNGFLNNYALRIPVSSGIVIPGYYMLYAINGSGVPSIARMLKIS